MRTPLTAHREAQYRGIIAGLVDRLAPFLDDQEHDEACGADALDTYDDEGCATCSSLLILEQGRSILGMVFHPINHPKEVF